MYDMKNIIEYTIEQMSLHVEKSISIELKAFGAIQKGD